MNRIHIQNYVILKIVFLLNGFVKGESKGQEDCNRRTNSHGQCVAVLQVVDHHTNEHIRQKNTSDKSRQRLPKGLA